MHYDMVTKIALKRIWYIHSPINAQRVAYEGYVGDKMIGVLFCNPITKELYTESSELLTKLGYLEYILDFE